MTVGKITYENGQSITWIIIIPDTNLSVPISYMTATYHNNN